MKNSLSWLLATSGMTLLSLVVWTSHPFTGTLRHESEAEDREAGDGWECRAGGSAGGWASWRGSSTFGAGVGGSAAAEAHARIAGGSIAGRGGARGRAHPCADRRSE